MKTNLFFSQISSFQDILSLSSKEFENFCAFLLTKEYSNICVTPFRGDKGIDISCEYGGNPVYVQCKQWNAEYKSREKKFYVEPRYIREFAGAMRREKAIYGIFITTLTFSPKAISEAEIQKIKLINKFDICHKMQCINPNFSFDEKTLKKQEYDFHLLKKLKNIRKEISSSEKKVLHHIVTNRTLEEFCYLKPQTREEFLKIHGIGEVKWRQYGEIFSFIIKEHLKGEEEKEYLEPQKELLFSLNKPQKKGFLEKIFSPLFHHYLSWKQYFIIGSFSFFLLLLLVFLQKSSFSQIWKASFFQ